MPVAKSSMTTRRKRVKGKQRRTKGGGSRKSKPLGSVIKTGPKQRKIFRDAGKVKRIGPNTTYTRKAGKKKKDVGTVAGVRG